MLPLKSGGAHFYIDNAPPEEVAWVLRCLSIDSPMSTDQIGERLYSEFGFRMQRDRTYSPKRLYDLGLAEQLAPSTKRLYALTQLGVRVRDLVNAYPDLYNEVMHFLHYSTYHQRPGSARPYLWSYWSCCNVLWSERRVLRTQEMAGTILGLMKAEFDLDYSARVGARFDATAVGRCYSWLKRLSPPPIPEEGDVLRPRTTTRHEVALLALSYVYAFRHYRYGDPVVLSDSLLDEVSRVFFLEPACCRELLAVAARITRAVRLSNTFAGTSVNLLEPYTIDRV